MSSNDAFLAAVSARIASAIMDFCDERIGGTFHADDLRRYVERKVGGTAPGSADRVLRDLRQRGELSYRCVDRARSLYLVEWVSIA